MGALDVLDVAGVAVADPPQAMAAKANIANVSTKNRVWQFKFKAPIRLNLGKKKLTSEVRFLQRRSDSHPFLRSASSHALGRSPGSWFRSVPLAFRSLLSGTVAIFLGVDHTSYSGATAPVSHRLPFSVPIPRDHLWT